MKFLYKGLEAGHCIGRTDSEFKAVGEGFHFCSSPSFSCYRKSLLSSYDGSQRLRNKCFRLIFKVFSTFIAQKLGLALASVFLVEAKKGECFLRRVWSTNSKFTRANWPLRKCRPIALTDYPRVFSILSCGTTAKKYKVTLNSLDNGGQKEEFRVNVAGSVAG